MKTDVVVGWTGVISAISYMLLSKYGLIALAPAVDSIMQGVSTLFGVYGGIKLQKSQPK